MPKDVKHYKRRVKQDYVLLELMWSDSYFSRSFVKILLKVYFGNRAAKIGVIK